MDQQIEERLEAIKMRLAIVGNVELSENRADALASLVFSDVP